MSAIQDLYQASREKDSKGIDGNSKPTQCFSDRKSNGNELATKMAIIDSKGSDRLIGEV